MIKQMIAWVAMAAFVVATAGPGFAQGTGTGTTPTPPASGSSTPAPPAAKAPAAKDAKMAMKPKSVTGKVKTTSADSLVLVTVDKSKKQKEWMFVLDKDTKITKGDKAIEAKDLTDKASATVTYTEGENKAMMAKTVKAKKS